MNGHLSKGERTRYIIASDLMDALKAWCNDPHNHLTKDEKKQLRTAATNIFKTCKSFALRLDEDYAKRLITDYKATQLALVPKRATTIKEEQRVTNDALYEIADMALTFCQDDKLCLCKRKGKEYRECELYKAMLDCAIPPASFEKGYCPYKLLSKGETDDGAPSRSRKRKK